MKSDREIMRIYRSVLQDLDRWDGKEPLEDFLVKTIEKRLFVNKEEAERITQQILTGIESYKKAKRVLKNKPQLLDKIISRIDKSISREIIDNVTEVFKSVKRSLSNER